MQRLRDGKESRDDKALAGIEFESLGVDMLIVDEAHHFKNLGVPVASADLGMQLSSAAKCEDLLDKCEWLREAGHGGNIAFMTGTPVSNSMSELYNMQRYLAPGTLKAQGLDTFAAWAGAYGQVVPTVELKPEGNGFQVKQRFARFQNLPELMNAVKQFTDMITNDDIQLPLPELEQVPVPVPITDRQKEEMEELSDRADRVRDGDVPPEDDNLLKITGDGRKIALDPKLLKGHETTGRWRTARSRHAPRTSPGSGKRRRRAWARSSSSATRARPHRADGTPTRTSRTGSWRWACRPSR